MREREEEEEEEEETRRSGRGEVVECGGCQVPRLFEACSENALVPVAYRQSSVRGWRGANGFEIAEACARVASCVSRDGVREVTYDLHDEF